MKLSSKTNTKKGNGKSEKQLSNRCIIIKQKFIFLIVECARRFLEIQQKTTKNKI